MDLSPVGRRRKPQVLRLTCPKESRSTDIICAPENFFISLRLASASSERCSLLKNVNPANQTYCRRPTTREKDLSLVPGRAQARRLMMHPHLALGEQRPEVCLLATAHEACSICSHWRRNHRNRFCKLFTSFMSLRLCQS